MYVINVLICSIYNVTCAGFYKAFNFLQKILRYPSFRKCLRQAKIVVRTIQTVITQLPVTISVFVISITY